MVVSKTPFELWHGWKPSLNHLHIWGCSVEVRIYNPHIKKLDPRTTSRYFIGYVVNSKGFRFYCPSHTPRTVEARNAKFLEDFELSGSSFPRRIEFEEAQDFIEPPSNDILEEQETHQEQAHIKPTAEISENTREAEGVKRSSRMRKPAIFDDYIVYLQESDFDIGPKDDPTLFSQAISDSNSTLWYDAMKEEMEPMVKNQVWDLVELPKEVIAIGCKWVYTTKRNASGNIERYKARLVAKGFTQKEGID